MIAPLTAVVVVTHGRAGADMLDAAQQICTFSCRASPRSA